MHAERQGPSLWPIVVCLFAASVAAARSQAPAADPSEAGLSHEIIVNGETEKAIDDLVSAMTDRRVSGQVARWQRFVCPRVLGLSERQATFLTDRIKKVAVTLGLRIANEGCGANIVVVVTGDAQGFAALLLKRHPALFRNPDEGMARSWERKALLAPRPVRWFSTSVTGNADGTPIPTGINMIQSASRISQPTRQNAALSFVIVDAAKLSGFKWGQLADYLAMVTLGQPAPDHDYTGEPTILALFDDEKAGVRPPRSLTREDRALLHGLYWIDPAREGDQQRASMRAEVKNALDRAPLSPPRE